MQPWYDTADRKHVWMDGWMDGTTQMEWTGLDWIGLDWTGHIRSTAPRRERQRDREIDTTRGALTRRCQKASWMMHGGPHKLVGSYRLQTHTHDRPVICSEKKGADPLLKKKLENAHLYEVVSSRGNYGITNQRRSRLITEVDQSRLSNRSVAVTGR
ncbi:hypothetical protein BGZ63DRAFT_98604 [Mariannaea sp. PMI_226]|nr:hypothetical protein BGZ63DRAFT_98604 [Mariannaea sp. PMI_226]